MATAPIETTQGAPAYRTIMKRGQSMGWMASSNLLFDGATQGTDRKQLSMLDRDTPRNITSYGRRVLMTLGRALYSNSTVVGGAIRQQATLSTESFIPQYYGADKAWGDEAENWLLNWGNICCIDGKTYSDWLQLLIICTLRDGDIGTLLTETPDGYPLIQVIQSHRIGSRQYGTQSYVIEDGPYKDQPLVDGCILDNYSRTVAYRIYDDTGTEFMDVPANALMLSYEVEWPDQVRGFSKLASGVFPWQDIEESRKFELIAQKAAAAIALLEQGESGTFNDSQGILLTAADQTATGELSTNPVEKLEGGLYRRFKAGRGCDLKAFAYDRPGASTQEYQATIIRDAMTGLDWDYWFTVEPSKVGGASMRVVVERINRTIRKRQKLVAAAAKRVHGYAISKAIKLGLLRQNVDWWKWEYQTAAEVTADRKYDSDVDVQEYGAGFTTLKRICGKRGEYWEDTQDQWIAEQKRKQDKAKAAGLDLTLIAGPEKQPNRTPREPNPSEDVPPGDKGDGTASPEAKSALTPVVNVSLPQIVVQPAQVNVPAPVVNVHTPAVTVNNEPAQVNVEPAQVHITNQMPEPKPLDFDVQRDVNGILSSIRVMPKEAHGS